MKLKFYVENITLKDDSCIVFTWYLLFWHVWGSNYDFQ